MRTPAKLLCGSSKKQQKTNKTAPLLFSSSSATSADEDSTMLPVDFSRFIDLPFPPT
jgi:hypothetical protein